jgi:hypothetical protein
MSNNYQIPLDKSWNAVIKKAESYMITIKYKESFSCERPASLPLDDGAIFLIDLPATGKGRFIF